MMKKSLTLGLFALLVLTPLAAPPRALAAVVFQKDIHVAPGEIQDKIFSLGGNVLIEGKVRDDVMVIGGSITISGEAGKSVVGIGSRIIVKSTAVIGKDLAALGGTLEKEPGCTVGGDTLYFQTAEIRDKIFKDGLLSGALSLSLIPVIVIFKLVIIFLWLMAAFLGAALLPKPLALAAGEVRKSFWPAFGIGFLAIIVFSGLVLFSALLSFILIGIPILLGLVAAGFIIKVFGRIVVFYFLGDSLLRTLGSRKISALGAVLAGLALFSFVGFIPVVGFLFGLVMDAVGWGIALRTKFGTRENWFQKKPAC
ncbi:MAG: hypothetical protein NT006_03595 [Candidatus Aminicenantes bacterium]|nr:hypothetical protein [Candidatus Aminicenantes bacterium]